MCDTNQRRVAIGFFDGVHLGHQLILQGADEVITFANHPLGVISPKNAPKLIMSLEERVSSIRSLVPNAKISVLDFTQELASTSAKDFAAKYLSGAIVRCGHDWRFGKSGEGDAAFLRRLSYSVEEVGDLSFSSVKVSSSVIRELLQNGNVILANAMLSRPFYCIGNVVAGKGLGSSELCCATLNIEQSDLPLRFGVYKVRIGSRPAVANYGLAPTFKENAWKTPVLEVHLLDGEPCDFKSVKVEFIEFLRDERKFDSLDGLKKQLMLDCERALSRSKILSVVITAKNEEANIGNCIKSFERFRDHVEIIVVDNSSTDLTKSIALSQGAKVLDTGPERCAQRNLGWRTAESDWVLILDADMIIPEKTVLEMIFIATSSSSADAYYIPEVRAGLNWRIKVRNFERSFYDGTCIDALRLFKKSVLAATNGYDEEIIAGGEDWELDIRVLQTGAKTAVMNSHLIHNEKNLSFAGMLRKKAYYASSFDVYKSKWPECPAVKKQFSAYYRFIGVFVENGKWKKILSHPILFASVIMERFFVGAVYIFKTISRRIKFPIKKGGKTCWK